MRELEGKVAIVTGAGRGLGRVEAIALARMGARVVINEIGRPEAREAGWAGVACRRLRACTRHLH